MNNDGADTVATPQRERISERQSWLGFAAVALLVIYIAVIGVFAIEQIEQRKDTLARIQAKRVGVLELKAMAGLVPGSEEAHSIDRSLKHLESLQARLIGLVSVGTMTNDGVLPKIACELVRHDAPHQRCEDPRSREWCKFFMGELIEITANGPLLAFLVIVAALGGGALRLSFQDDLPHGQRRWRLVRSVGGGLVCYVALNGRAVPSTLLLDTALAADPARWSLIGLLVGMFANRVFEVISAGAEAFLKKLDLSGH